MNIYFIYLRQVTLQKEKIYFKIPITDLMMVNEESEKYEYSTQMLFLEENSLKSPLNYVGGKYKLLPQLLEYFPKEINTFVDMFSGGFNVGINVDSKKTICNDINSFIIDLYKELYKEPINNVLGHIQNRIDEYGLSKENEDGFKKI